MHCHLDVHLGWGLAMAFIVENGVGELETLEPPPADLPVCWYYREKHWPRLIYKCPTTRPPFLHSLLQVQMLFSPRAGCYFFVLLYFSFWYVTSGGKHGAMFATEGTLSFRNRPEIFLGYICKVSSVMINFIFFPFYEWSSYFSYKTGITVVSNNLPHEVIYDIQVISWRVWKGIIGSLRCLVFNLCG